MEFSGFDKTTQQLVNYAVNLQFNSIPHASVESVNAHLLDAMGCALGANSSRPADIGRKIAATALCADGASVLGLQTKTTPEYAAFANTAMIRHLDYNDTGIGGHPSDMIPSILALAELAKASGKKVIKAIFAAYEVVAALRRAGMYGVRLRKRHIDQVQSVLGSVVGSGIILDLSLEKMAHAISLALTPNIPMRVVRVGELSDWKGCATAHCSMMAVFAARLAQQGLTGPGKPFDGPAGFIDVLNIDSLDLCDLGESRMGLSAVESTCYKFYPAEFNAQGPIGTILELRKEFDLEDIEGIAIELHWAGWHEIGGGQDDKEEKWNPKTRESADHSLPYLIAVALMDGEVTLDSFTDKRVSDPKLRPLMQKISVMESEEITKEHYGELPKWPSVTTITLKNGKQIKQHSGLPKGHPLNPLNDKELKDKFMRLSRLCLAREQADNFYEGIMNLEKIRDINDLTVHFRF